MLNIFCYSLFDLVKFNIEDYDNYFDELDEIFSRY